VVEAGGMTDDEIADDYLKAINDSVDLSGVNAIWIYFPEDISKITGQWTSQITKLSSPKYGALNPMMVALGADTYLSKRVRWGYFIHELLHAHGLWGHSPKFIPSNGRFTRIGALSTADGWSNALLPWDALVANWQKPSDIYCVDKPKLATVDLKLVPLEREQAGIRSVMIKLNDQSEFVDLKYITNIFEVLGLFSMTQSCSVYLCDGLIDACAKKNSFDVKVLEEVIYIHECAHFIHYHLNSGSFRNCPFNLQERSLYVETFAQLITHVICKEISNDHFKVFEKLKEGQQDVYALYNEYVIACDKDYLIKLFLSPQPKNNENVIDFIKDNYDIRNLSNLALFHPWQWKAVTSRNEFICNDKILTPLVLQTLIDIDPPKMAEILKADWKNIIQYPGYEDLKWPNEHKKECTLIIDLNDVGL
jgi:hypothetical protein